MRRQWKVKVCSVRDLLHSSLNIYCCLLSDESCSRWILDLTQYHLLCVLLWSMKSMIRIDALLLLNNSWNGRAASNFQSKIFTETFWVLFSFGRKLVPRSACEVTQSLSTSMQIAFQNALWKAGYLFMFHTSLITHLCSFYYQSLNRISHKT